jgi:hypothetical protein
MTKISTNRYSGSPISPTDFNPISIIGAAEIIDEKRLDSRNDNASIGFLVMNITARCDNTLLRRYRVIVIKPNDNT